MDVMELARLVVWSLVPGDNWEGLCGVCGWNDMMKSMSERRSGKAADVASDPGQRNSGWLPLLGVSKLVREADATDDTKGRRR